MKQDDAPIGFWFGQLKHLVFASILLAMTCLLWAYLGAPYPAVFWAAVIVPIAHQVFVWLSWRIALRVSDERKSAFFKPYIAGFFLLFSGRFMSLFVLAYLDRGSLNLSTGLAATLAGACLVLGVYAMYSVRRYFGMRRAAGADHFESRFRQMPFVKQGIFRFTSNAMYVYAFLLFWAIALSFNSAAALVVAAFSHLYIWVHYFCTEKPDMDFIYGSNN
ncbi:methyltransferase [Agarivorans sp. 1_MG-2023]|uniref:methyltransferase n=1 Tax=Agarivorans sp. 1_MG-2023 TaxID=3062634 RepID=UPI0026E12851|nr:methyltransferase [Agarivorans sp. 1_MG-2023]MDO6762881.1 methyltransferase [Agarivorans sp. 1_MG-2023]